MLAQFKDDLQAILDQRFIPGVADLLARIDKQGRLTYEHLENMNASLDRIE